MGILIHEHPPAIHLYVSNTKCKQVYLLGDIQAAHTYSYVDATKSCAELDPFGLYILVSCKVLASSIIAEPDPVMFFTFHLVPFALPSLSLPPHV